MEDSAVDMVDVNNDKLSPNKLNIAHNDNRHTKYRKGKKGKYDFCVTKKVFIEDVAAENNNANQVIEGGSGWKKTRRGKKKRNRNNKRRHSNYKQLSCQEIAQLDEMAANEATQLYKKRAQSGVPVTPFNTTQFIMDDYEKARARLPSDSKDMLEEFERIADKSEVNSVKEDEFTAQFEDVRFDKYDQMSKGELVKQCYKLDKKVQELEETEYSRSVNDRLRATDGNTKCDKQGDNEMELLRKEIYLLKQENANLSNRIDMLMQ